MSDKKGSAKNASLPVIGWREWVGLPDLGVPFIKAKVDTGARSSSLHAFEPKIFTRDEAEWVRFCIHPNQRNSHGEIEVEAPILEFRNVRSSSGKASRRPVIITNIRMLDLVWPVEITLANRDEMGFRMLLGREAFRAQFLVDAGKSYYSAKPASTRKKKKKGAPPK